uniref:Uncharacterized protein n=1 Tax=Rhizophora mucronata TaxID=61149 RepID=A0A2P2MYK0_RHIMU
MMENRLRGTKTYTSEISAQMS